MELIDTFGRLATDLRLSVTDRCDLRCTYCMPEEGLAWAAPAALLSFEEIERVVRIGITGGIRSVRLTGGEPLMRQELPELVKRLAALGLDDLSMTTNGTTLARHARGLKDGGLNRVNVSVDSLDRHRFAAMTRRDRLHKVLDGIEAAAAVGLSPIKINCVVMRGINDTEAVEFAALARSTGSHVRFIEYMPLDADHGWKVTDVVPAAELVARIEAAFPLRPAERDGSPAVVYKFADGSPGSIGMIASVTEPFCSSCDRLRLTADGQLQSCLFAADETDLRTLLRNGSSDSAIASAMLANVTAKQSGHSIGNVSFLQPKRSMSMIGG